MTMIHTLSVAFIIFMPMVYSRECHCQCGGQLLCDQVHSITAKLDESQKLLDSLIIFRDNWRNEILEAIEQKVKEHIAEGKISSMFENTKEENSEPVPAGHNLDTLFAALKRVENRTREVEAGLQKERHETKFLKETMNKTRSSLISVSNRLNATVPFNTIMDQVQIVVHSSVEDLNKTLQENHLKKIYGELDGVAHKNENRALTERLERVEAELRDRVNNSIFSTLTEDLTLMQENFHVLNRSVGNTVIPLLESLSNSLEHSPIPRLEVLEFQAISKDEELEKNMTNLSNHTEVLVEGTLVDGQPSIEKNNMNGQDDQSCVKPEANDSHALIDIVNDTHGRSTLKFGCRPIGSYLATRLPIPSRCEKGSWTGPLPSCKKLSSVKELESFSRELLKGWSCSAGPGVYADPFNCSQYIKCLNESPEIVPCRSGLIYNNKLKNCSEPTPNLCDTTKIENALQNLTPPIYVYGVDEAGSRIGTGTAGELMVLPGNDFTLRCDYPAHMWEPPKWNVTYFYKNTRRNIESMSKQTRNGVRLAVKDAQEDDSGIYTCSTNFGAEHAIEVQVKEVTCPALDDFIPSYVNVIGTLLQFWCKEGRWLFANCKADGNWSKDIPSPDECSLWGSPIEIYK